MDVLTLTKLEFQVQQYLDLLSHGVKREYLEAVATAPPSVVAECSTRLFLQACQWQPERAATRIAEYWKLRKLLFGADRWLLPMTATGFGALSADDLEIWRSGYCVPVPTNKNASGDTLFLIDNSRLPRYPGITQARLIFYWNHICGPQNKCPKVHVITGQKCPPHPVVEDEQVQQISLQTIEALPIVHYQPCAPIVAQTYEAGKQELLDFLGYQTVRSLEFQTGETPLRVAASSLRATVQQLESLGLLAQHLPPALGGCYDYQQFDYFLAMRITLEGGAMSAAPLHLNRWSSSAVATVPMQQQQAQHQAQQQAQQQAQGWNDNHHRDSSLSPTPIADHATPCAQQQQQHFWDRFSPLSCLESYHDDDSDKTQQQQQRQQQQFDTNTAMTLLPTEQAALPTSNLVVLPQPQQQQPLLPFHAMTTASSSTTIVPAPVPLLTNTPSPTNDDTTATTGSSSNNTPATTSMAPPAAAAKSKPKKVSQAMRQRVVTAQLQQKVQDLEVRNQALKLSNRQYEHWLAQARLLAALQSSTSTDGESTTTTTTTLAQQEPQEQQIE